MQLEKWVFNNLEDALVQARMRNTQGIRVILDPLSPPIKDVKHLDASIQDHTRALNIIRAQGLYASLAVKLSALGMDFDQDLCKQTLLSLADDGLKRSVQLEIDMEGKSSVDFAISCAIELADEGYRTTLAVQAYLDRTPNDIEKLVKEGVSIRLVKGAYQGDTSDYDEIQRRIIHMADDLLTKRKKFSIGTHDPVVIEKVMKMVEAKRYVEFGLLMGMGDKTKILLSTGEWNAAEYIPYGGEYKAYVHRRENHLKLLEKERRFPAP